MCVRYPCGCDDYALVAVLELAINRNDWWYAGVSMAKQSTNEKEQAHQLLDRLAPNQVSAVVGLLEAMLDPVSRAISNAPIDDEPESEEERLAVAKSKAWFERQGGKGISNEEVLAEFGFTHTDTVNKKG
jgi:hypothetical protein